MAVWCDLHTSTIALLVWISLLIVVACFPIPQRHQVKKTENIVGFIDEIRANLSDQAYSSFKTALALYKEVHTHRIQTFY